MAEEWQKIQQANVDFLAQVGAEGMENGESFGPFGGAGQGTMVNLALQTDL